MKKVFFTFVALMGLMCNQALAQCDTVSAFPWEANFSNGLGCWQQSGNGYWKVANAQAVYGLLNHGVTSTGYTTLTTPAIRLDCDSTGLRLWWKDQRSYFYPTLKVIVLKENGTSDTIHTADMGNGGHGFEQHSVSLAAYVGQTVRIAFNVRFISGGYDYRGTLSEIGIYSQYTPRGSLSAPKLSTVGSSAAAILTLTQGQAPIRRTWHSTLLGDFVDIDTLPLSYTEAGWDTLTVTASNAFGSLTKTAVVRVHECGPTLPWREDFDGYDTAAYNVCWTINGWQHQNKRDSTGYDDETGKYHYYSQLMTGGNNASKYMLSPALSIPAEGVEHLRLWVQSYRVPMVRISPTASLTPTDYTDTLHPGANTSKMAWQLFDLSAYAGQTIRVGIFGTSNSPSINCVQVDYDTLPVAYVTGSQETIIDSSTLFTAHLRHGAEDNLHYIWSSRLGGTIITNTMGDSMWVSYSVGGVDTLTAVAINAYGSDTVVSTITVFECDTIIDDFPWVVEFVATGIEASYKACWEISGWSHIPSNDNYGCYYEDGNYETKNDLMRSSAANNYMVLPPVRVPETGAERLKVWVTYFKKMLVTISTDGGQTYPDTVYYDNANINNYKLRAIPLAPYAGQTVHVRLASTITSSYLDRVAVDYDTTPHVNLVVPATAIPDNATLCVATLRYGDTAGLTYTWHSAVGGSFVTNAAGDSAWVTYSAGITGFNDTVSVVVSNLFGSETARRALRVINCLPQTSLPWTEKFDDGIVCWYKPEGSNWVASTEYGGDPKTMASGRIADSQPQWIMSKAVDIPADTGLMVRLFWSVSNSSSSYPVNYSVWVTTSEDYTDTANYTMLYLDTAYHSTYLFFDRLSASLAPYAGQTIHLAFRNAQYLNNATTLYIDNVTVRSMALPVVRFNAPSWVNSHETVSVEATFQEGSTSGLTCTLHSSLLDTTMTAVFQLSTINFQLFYPFGGIDTLTCITTNAYGSATVSALVDVFNCTSIDSLPWTEDFSTITAFNYNVGGNLPNCWHSYWNGTNTDLAPHVVNDYWQGTSIQSYVQNNNALALVGGTYDGYDSIAIVETPAFEVPLAGYKLSFYYMYEADRGQLSVGYMQNDSFVSLAEIEPQTSGRTEYMMLDGMPSDVDRIAFRWSCVSGFWHGVILDSIRVAESDSLPMVRLALDRWVAYAGDTTTFSAQLLDGSTDNLRFSWHSSLVDTTIVTMDPVVNLVYSVGGCDTLTLVATNAYGSATASAEVTVIDCSPIASLPWTEDFETTPAVSFNAPNGQLPNCWYGYWIGANAVYAPHVISNNGYQYIDMLSSQALLMMAAGNTSGFGTVEQVVLPRFSQPSQELAIAFDYLFEYIDKGTLTVGYLDRNNTFVAIADMTPHAGSYRRDTVRLGAIPYSSASIALRWQCSYGIFYAVAIDNIEVFAVTPDLQGIEETGSSRWNVEVFPNPASTDVTVRVSRPSTLTLLDLQGRTVIPSTTVNTQFPIRKSQLAPGTYFLRVTTDNNTMTKKLVIL